MTWAEDKALRGRNLSADQGVANESGRLPMPPDSFPLICNINAKNPKVNTLSVSLIQRTGFHFRLNQNNLAGLTSLNRLRLDNNQITDNGLIHLAGLMNLDTLSLNNTQITDSGLIHLRSLKNLLRLSIEEDQITDRGICELRKALPLLDVRSGKTKVERGPDGLRN